MPDSGKYTRRRVLTIAIVTTAGLTVAALGQSSLSAGGPGERRVIAESRPTMQVKRPLRPWRTT
jgi:hypothetical protein